MGIQVRYVSKADSKLMRFFGFFSSSFMTDYWTTIEHTIYYPTTVTNPLAPENEQTRNHEALHVKQFERYGWFLMGCAILFFPLPVLFSGRWWIERTPYLEDIKAYKTIPVEAFVDALSCYLYPWPKCLMRRWFLKQLSRSE